MDALARRRNEAAREALLCHLHQRLEQALDRSTKATALDQMASVAQLCMEAGRFAAVIDVLGLQPLNDS